MSKSIFLSFLAFLCTTFLLTAQVDSTIQNTLFQKLVKEQFTRLIIEADFDSLVNNKNKNLEQFAKLSFRTVTEKELNVVVKVRARGLFRRKFCDIPPLRLNFDKEQLAEYQLNIESDKLKLVTHCINSERDQALMREYWTYKLYNELSVHSFQVHLLKISYVDKYSKKVLQERMGFIIESNKELATRIGGKLVDKFGLTATNITKDSYQNCMMFNYMIGNLDWNLQSQRNLKLIQLPETEKIILIPYDFDMSALVWPSYARLNPDFKQQNFKDRYCVGKFKNIEAVKKQVQIFESLKGVNLNCFDSCPYLTNSSKTLMETYINSFYKIIGKEKRLKKIFL